MKKKSIEKVIKECAQHLMSIPGVVGVAHGLRDDQDCIKIYVISKNNNILKDIPAEFEGYKVDVEETGEFTNLSKK